MEDFLLFLVYSLFGCVLEDAYNFMHTGEYVSKRTLLTLPLCPVYGLAGIMLAAVNRTENPMGLFMNGVCAVSALELAYYLISLRVYGIKWWDYSAHKFNLYGGICPYYSVMWGLINIPFALWIHPSVSVWVSGLTQNTRLIAGAFAGVYVLADMKRTHAELLKYKNGEKNLITERFLYIKSNN